MCDTTSVIKDPQATRNLNLIHYIDIVDFSNEKTCMILVEQHSPVVTTRIQNIVNKVWINQFIKKISHPSTMHLNFSKLYEKNPHFFPHSNEKQVLVPVKTVNDAKILRGTNIINH